jgi:hypothetical protein
VLLFPAVALFAGIQGWRDRGRRRAIAAALVICLLTGSLLGGWFYGVLKIRRGAATAFNMKRAPTFTLRNHPAIFYTGLGLDELFHRPVRPSFADQFLPIFYSETWGDYWCYFSVYGRDTRKNEYVYGIGLAKVMSKKTRPHWLQTNYETMNAYLGRVNLVSTYPSALALIALAFGVVTISGRDSRLASARRRKDVFILLLLAMATTLAGYFWFLIMHTGKEHGLSIRATHVLQIFPCVAILAGSLMDRIRQRSPMFYGLILLGLVLVFAHNICAMMTHY